MPGGKRKREAEPQPAIKKLRAVCVIENLENLDECVICTEFLTSPIYQCSNGHSICAKCFENPNNGSCGTCRIPYQKGAVKIRSILAEQLLAKLLFYCSWTDNGCKSEGMSRQQLSEHEAHCSFNPNPVKLCEILFRNDCPFEICPVQLKKAREEVQDLIRGHLLKDHPNKRICLVFPGEVETQSVSERLFTSDSRDFTLFDMNKVIRLEKGHGDYLGLYTFYLQKDYSEPEVKVAWIAVCLIGPTSNYSVKVTFSYKKGSSSFEWEGQIISIFEFSAFRNKKRTEREKLKFSLPLSMIRDFYREDDGSLNLHFKFIATRNESESDSSYISSEEAESSDDSD